MKGKTGLATGRIGPSTVLRVVGAVVTGVHEPGDSHYELLRAFAGEPLLRRISEAFEQSGYRSHEFGDSVFLAAFLTGEGRQSRVSEGRPHL